MTDKRRIDQLLVERGLAESRARAQALVMAGLVFAGETRVDKPGQQVREDAALEVRGRDHPWVGRGGVKLAHALDHNGGSTEKHAKYMRDTVDPAMAALRELGDRLELTVPSNDWPLPSYREMLFIK